MRRFFAVAVVGVLLLTGCGDDEESTETGGASDTTHATTHEGHSDTEGAPCQPSGTTLSIVASSTRFDKNCLAAPANQAVTISFENKDATNHNLAILKSHTATDVIARADIFTGPKTVTLNVPGQPAGTYAFHCEVHPSVMTGTFVVK